MRLYFLALSLGGAFLFSCTTVKPVSYSDRACVDSLDKFFRSQTKSTSLEDGLTQSQISPSIDAKAPEFKKCFVEKLFPNETINGEVKLAFLVDPQGKVARSCVEHSTFDSSDLRSCLTSVLRSISFPKPRGGVYVRVGYPFQLNVK